MMYTPAGFDTAVIAGSRDRPRDSLEVFPKGSISPGDDTDRGRFAPQASVGLADAAVFALLIIAGPPASASVSCLDTKSLNVFSETLVCNEIFEEMGDESSWKLPMVW